MPIGIALGTAAIGAGGAYLASKSQSKAINNANETTQENNAANLAFMRDMYGQNTAQLAPWSWGGMEAGNALLGMLLPGYKPKSLPGMPASGTPGGGGGASLPGGTPVGGGTTGGPGPGGAPYTQAQINAMWHNNTPGDAQEAQAALNAWLQAHPGVSMNTTPAGAPFTETQIGDMWHDGIEGNAASAESALSAWLAAHPTGTTAPAAPAAPAAVPQVTSQAAFTALPSGTHFIAPDGTQRIKP